jgi:hypothetical protein
MLYPLSYRGGTSANGSADGSALCEAPTAYDQAKK